MSWGERSCKYMGNCPTEPTMETCNVDCIYYESNGKEPDSAKRKEPIPFVPPTAELDRETKNFIDVVCRDGAGVRLRASWDLKYRKEVIKCLKR